MCLVLFVVGVLFSSFFLFHFLYDRRVLLPLSVPMWLAMTPTMALVMATMMAMATGNYCIICCRATERHGTACCVRRSTAILTGFVCELLLLQNDFILNLASNVVMFLLIVLYFFLIVMTC